MTTFTREKLTEIKNPQYQYYKLKDENGVCQFDEFCAGVEQNAADKKLLPYIFKYMERLTDRQMLPKEKFNHVEGIGRDDVFEFKKKSLRVYVIKQKPDVFVIMGGYKNEQKKDIARIKKIIKDMKIT